MQYLSETIGQDKLDELFNAQGGSKNSMNFEEAMLKIRKQIDDLKSQGYGEDN